MFYILEFIHDPQYVVSKRSDAPKLESSEDRREKMAIKFAKRSLRLQVIPCKQFWSQYEEKEICSEYCEVPKEWMNVKL